jgi:hypothetical protein
MELLEAANRALVTPRLHQALAAAGLAEAIPDEAASFIRLVADRNDARNLKLRGLALDAVDALNAVGVTPVYLKGMAVWATCHPAAESCARMMSDVDLLVRPEEADRGLDALLARGFRLIKRYPGEAHVVAELWREGDVGVLDLHRRAPGPTALAELFDRDAHTQGSNWPGSARLPSPAHQIYLTCLHDMFHDGGFWRGGFDVRHLCDIADLSGGPQGVDWDALKAILQTRLVRNAVLSQLVAAHRLTAAPIPQEMIGKIVPVLHYQRHRAQYLHPGLGFQLAVLGIGLEALNIHQYWPHLGAEGMTASQLLWWLRRSRPYPNKI